MGFFNQPFKRRVFVTQEKGQGLKKKHVTTSVCLYRQGILGLLLTLTPSTIQKFHLIIYLLFFLLHSAVEEESQ